VTVCRVLAGKEPFRMFRAHFRSTFAVGALVAGLVVPGTAWAQTLERPAPGRPAAAAQPQVTGNVNQNAEQTRQDFYEVLQQYPPALGRVLRLDPTLMTNETYLASYPNVAAFIAENPDVPRNPGYYLERYDGGYAYAEPQDARAVSLSIWRDAIDFLGAFLVVAAVVIAIFSLMRYVVEYRRWAKISKVNAEVHNKILDRFGSNEELLAYIDSPAGRRFLEATPIAATAAPAKHVGAPFGRILLSVQVGVVLLALGLGFLVISWDAIEEVRPILTSLAVLGFALGVGSIGSGVASYVISRRLGLLQDRRDARPEPIA
jgi:hypothetical protein